IHARLRIGDQGDGGVVEGLPEPLMIGEEEGFVLLDWAAGRNAELVSFEGRRRRTGIEEVARVKRVIPQKLVHRTMPLIGAGLRDDGDLAARLLAVFRAVGVTQDIEFPHRVDAQQLAARAAGCYVVFRRARVLDAVKQEQVLLWSVARNRKHVRGSRIGDAY